MAARNTTDVVVPPGRPSQLAGVSRTTGITRVVFDRERASKRPVHFILADVASPRISTHHDPEKLSRVIMKRIWH